MQEVMWVKCCPTCGSPGQEQVYPSFSEQLSVSAGSVFWSNQFAEASAWLHHVVTHPTNLCVSQTTCDLPLSPAVVSVAWCLPCVLGGTRNPGRLPHSRVPSAWALCHPGAALWAEATVTK